MGQKDTDAFREADVSSTGSVETRKVQTGGRVNIPDGFLRHIGVGGEGKRVIVVCGEDEIIIREANIDSLPFNRDGGRKNGENDG